MGDVRFRSARPGDEDEVFAIVGADPVTRDRVGAAWPTDRQRDGYRRALAADDHELLVGERDGAVVAVLQLSFLPELARDGDRAQLETVHVAASERGAGIGGALVQRAVERARDRGCSVVQLTSSKHREDAHRFYRALGFEPSHEGFKLQLRGG